MTDQQPHTPTVDELRRMYALKAPHDQRDRRNAEFDRFLAAAEQRGAIKALRDAAESNDVIDHMYKYFDNHTVQSPAAVRATATYLHDRADRMEGDDE